jgi:peptide/nickel transport system substrate-binding protein
VGAIAVGLLLATLVAACGSQASGGGHATIGSTDVKLVAGTRGGTVTFLSATDVDSLDPGLTSFSVGYMVLQATQRPLYSFKPNDPTTLVPDLASGMPKISSDLKTVTVHIKPGIHFSPPVDRELTSSDVKYAIERTFTKEVTTYYAGTYFGSIVGAPAKPHTGNFEPISGIETPNATTLVFHLSKPVGGQFVSTLVMGATAPVPQEYAQKFDSQNPSTYAQHVVATGAYMVQNNAAGDATGWTPGKRILLVRNPNWNAKSDFRPAYLNSIQIAEGNSDVTIATRRALSGSGLMCCDVYALPVDIVRQAEATQKSQIAVLGARLTSYVALDTAVKPFDNLNVRRAVLAGVDRSALRLTRGGPLLGDVATGFIPPGLTGFEQSGGMEQAQQYDFNKNPQGSMALARKYMLAARQQGLPISAAGKWTGGGQITAVAPNEAPDDKTAEALQAQLGKLGLTVKLRLVPRSVVYTNFCGVPAKKVGICFVGVGSDTADPYSILSASFLGTSILPAGNSNISQLNNPAVNAAIDKASLLPVGTARSKAWGTANALIVGQAAGIPYEWPKAELVSSRNVQMVPNEYYDLPDLAFTSVKR